MRQTAADRTPCVRPSWVIGITLTIAALATLGGCSASRRTVVATDAVFPPFHYVDESGDLTGYDVELARTALDRAGREAHVVRAESFAELFDGLVVERFDVIAATSGITSERLERYAMTRPYFVTCLAVIVRAGDGEPTSPAELIGRRIAAASGTTSSEAAHRVEGAEVVETTRKADSVAALRAREVDAIIIDEFEAVPIAREADDLAVMAQPAAIESYGLVLRREDTELRDQLDAALIEMEADGTLAELRARFGLDRPDGWPVKVETSGTSRITASARVR